MPGNDSCSLAILGLGNELCGDDSLGCTVVRALTAGYTIPDGVTVVDAGALGSSALAFLASAPMAIVVDAVRVDSPPGAFFRLQGREVVASILDRLAPQGGGNTELEAGGSLPDPVILLGLVPKTVQSGLERSSVVEAGLPGLIKRVVLEARLVGYELVPKGHTDLSSGRDTRPAARAVAL
jgi:hydrogenase maturation protease